MGKEKRSFQSCFVIIIGVGLFLIVLLYYVTRNLNMSDPNSELGKKIDSMIPQAEAVQRYAEAKLTLQKIHMRGVKDAFVMYYVQYDKSPESIEEMIARKVVGQEALKDKWGNRHRYLPYDREIYLVSAGPDRIYNTNDDLMVMLMDPTLEVPEEDRTKVIQLVSEETLKGKVPIPPPEKPQESKNNAPPVK